MSTTGRPIENRPSALRRFFQAFSTAVVVGSMTAIFALSFASIVYSGPLLPFLSQGIALTLVGALIMGITGPLTLSYRGTLVQPQDITAILLALCAASIAARPGFAPEAAFATVVVLVGLTSVVTGIAAYAMGVFKLGYIARFVPFPVISGFLAASGALLMRGAFDMVAPDILKLPGGWLTLLTSGWPLWLPWLLLAAAVVAAARIMSNGFVIPAALAVALAGFYVWMALTGYSVDDLRQVGVLLGPFEGTSFASELNFGFFKNVDWPALLAQAPVVVTIVGISLLGTLLNASGLELAIDREIDFGRDLKGVGISNVAAGLAGGMVGYHTLGETLLARRFGASGVSIGVGVVLAAVIVLFFGAGVLSYLPVGIFAAVIWYLGLDLILTAIWEHGRRMPMVDLLIVVITPLIALFFGFMPAVAFGMAVAALVFIIAYSGVDVTRLSTTGANFHARIERAPADQLRLAALGSCVQIHRLDGYIFFGSASKLIERLQGHFDCKSPPRFAIVDFERVVGMDMSAWAAFERLGRNCAQQGTRLFLTGLSPMLKTRFARSDRSGSLASCRDLDEVLIDIEEQLLSEPTSLHDAATEQIDNSFVSQEKFGGLLREYGHSMTLDAGDTLMAQGSQSDHLIFLLEGRCRATVTDRNGDSRVVSRFLPGAMVGEIAYYAGVARTATVTAETAATVVRIDAAGLSRMEQDAPALAASFHRMLAVVLARRLMTTTRLLNDAEL